MSHILLVENDTELAGLIRSVRGQGYMMAAP